MRETQRGFTIVELLVVIVVIAILAAITIVSYSGIQTSAQWARAKSEAQGLGNTMEIYRLDNGTYPTDNAAYASVLKSSGLWNSTRSDSHTYSLCSTSSEFHITPHPYKGFFPDPTPIGFELNVYSSSQGWHVVLYNPDAEPANTAVASDVCATLLPGQTRYQNWSHVLSDT